MTDLREKLSYVYEKWISQNKWIKWRGRSGDCHGTEIVFKMKEDLELSGSTVLFVSCILYFED